MKISLTKNVFVGLTWVLLLIAIPTSLYVAHVYGQLREVRENNLRTLSKAAEVTNQILQTAVDNVRNLKTKPAFACQFADRQPYLKWGAAHDCASGGITRQSLERAYLSAGLGGVQVRAKPTKESSETPYVFDVQFDVLLAAIPFSDVLDLLFIVDGKGDVIVQHQPEDRPDVGLVIGNLNGLPFRNSDKVTKIEALQNVSSISALKLSGTDYQMLCQPLMLSPDVSSMTGSDAGDSGHWMLCGLVADERSLRQSLLVAPFLAFALFAVTVFGFLTWPAIKLLWMTRRDRLYFADLCFLLFGTWGSLMLAVILVLGIGSYRILTVSSEKSLQQLANQIELNLQTEIDGLTDAMYAIDGELATFVNGAGTLTAGSVDDIARLYAVDTAEDRHGLRDAWGKQLTGEWPLKSDFEMVFWAACSGKQVFKATVSDSNTPRVNVGHRDYFRAAYSDRLWLGPESGRQARKPRFVEALRSITTGRFATVISAPSQVPIRKLAGLSNAPEAVPNRDPCPGIVALQAVLVSTSSPVLPPGVGFAVIDEAGNVILHSDERRALFENLYEEMSRGDRLHSMVIARTEESIKTSYLGRSHQVFVKPFKNIPWSVVTFSDREMISTANLEGVGHAAILAFLYLAIYALLTLCYFLLRGPEIPVWFWPGSTLAKPPLWLIAASAAALLALVYGLLVLGGDAALMVTFALPAIAFIGICAASRYAGSHPAALVDSNLHVSQLRWSVASAMTAWMIVAIIPAALFFNSALNNQARLLVRYENEYLASRIAERNCAVDDYYQAIDRSELCESNSRYCRFAQRRSFDAGDLYPSAMFWPQPVSDPVPLDVTERIFTSQSAQRFDFGGTNGHCGPDDQSQGDIWSLFPQYKPIYNRTMLRSRYLQPDAQSQLAYATTWSWQPNSEGCTALFTAAPLACGTEVTVKSGLPSRSTVYGNPAVLAGATLLLIGLFFWARYGARRIFFGDLQAPNLRSRAELEQKLAEKRNHSETRLIAIVASQADRARLLKAAVLPSGSGSSADPDRSKTHGEFSRYDITALFRAKSKRSELLAELEKEIVSGTNILLVSSADPFAQLIEADSQAATDPGSEPGATMQDDELHRWRQLLSLFRVVIVTLNKSSRPQVSKRNWQRGLDDAVSDEWLKAEFDAAPDLEPFYDLLKDELLHSSRRNALDRIVERAFGCYTALWDACSEEEKLVLVQIALENVANPKQILVVRRLLQRGFLVRDPGLRIMNQSFARFIAQVQDPVQVREWEHSASGVSWTHTRWVLMGALFFGLLFLWATQRELFNSTIMFLSAAAVGVPGIIKVITNLGKSGGQGSN